MVYIWSIRGLHGIPYNILREYHGVSWSLYGPMVFRGSFHWLTRAIFMECMESHGTPCHSTATMAFHGEFMGLHMEFP